MTTQYLPPRPAQPHLPRRAKPHKKQGLSPLVVTGGAFVLGAAMIMVVAITVLLLALSVERIPSGVQVAGIDLGGERLDDAEAILRAGFPGAQITATDGERSWNVTLADL